MKDTKVNFLLGGKVMYLHIIVLCLAFFKIGNAFKVLFFGLKPFGNISDGACGQFENSITQIRIIRFFKLDFLDNFVKNNNNKKNVS